MGRDQDYSGAPRTVAGHHAAAVTPGADEPLGDARARAAAALGAGRGVRTGVVLGRNAHVWAWVAVPGRTFTPPGGPVVLVRDAPATTRVPTERRA